MFCDIYYFVLNEENFEIIKAKLQGVFLDERQPFPPFLTVSGMLASHGLNEKAALLRTLGACSGLIASGYAFVGNHQKVEEYRLR